MHDLATTDPELAAALRGEQTRQEQHIELIASENYASPAVLAAQGSVLTNKYAEGYPGKRYYGGCEHVDIAEQLALDRVKQLFGADYANVQPHSGAQANAAAFMALLEPHDLILGMRLSEGGHLTHGSPVNFSGKIYKAIHYGLDASGLVDYVEMRKLAQQHQPKVIVGGFSAHSRCVDWVKMRAIADEVGAYLVVDMAHVAGLIAAGIYPDPLPHAHVVTSTTHKSLRGPRGGLILTKGQPALAKKINSAVFPGAQGGPLMHVIAAKAVAFGEALKPSFVDYQKQVVTNAQTMAKVLMERGYDVVSGGTDNHLMLVSFVDRDLSGKRAEEVLGQANITLNKNAVPNDPRSPFVTSGIRLGTPACTTRGFKEEQAGQTATWICDILDDPDNEARVDTIRHTVLDLCARFPVYGAAPFLKQA